MRVYFHAPDRVQPVEGTLVLTDCGYFSRFKLCGEWDRTVPPENGSPSGALDSLRRAAGDFAVSAKHFHPALFAPLLRAFGAGRGLNDAAAEFAEACHRDTDARIAAVLRNDAQAPKGATWLSLLGDSVRTPAAAARVVDVDCDALCGKLGCRFDAFAGVRENREQMRRENLTLPDEASGRSVATRRLAAMVYVWSRRAGDAKLRSIVMCPVPDTDFAALEATAATIVANTHDERGDQLVQERGEDGMVNVFDLCKHSGRSLDDWVSRRGSRDLMCALARFLGCDPDELVVVDRQRGSREKLVHRLLLPRVLRWMHSGVAK